MEGAVNEMDHRGDAAGEDASSRATPVMAQFLVLKQANPGSLLFFRMGDFYELFFEDAKIAASVLEPEGFGALDVAVQSFDAAEEDDTEGDDEFDDGTDG